MERAHSLVRIESVQRLISARKSETGKVRSGLKQTLGESCPKMKNMLVRKLGGPALSVASRQVVGENKPVDVRFGVALMRDRRVPVASKMAALALGFVLTFALEALELPLESVLAFLLPVIGFGINLVVDGAELLALPLLFSAALLPHIAPKPVVARIREERGGLVAIPVEQTVRR